MFQCDNIILLSHYHWSSPAPSKGTQCLLKLERHEMRKCDIWIFITPCSSPQPLLKPVQVFGLLLFTTAACDVIWDLRCEQWAALVDKLMFLYRNRSCIGRKSYLLQNPSRVEAQTTKINTEPSVVFFSLVISGNFSYHFDQATLLELFGQIPTFRRAHWLPPNRVIFMCLEGLPAGFIPRK